MLTLPDSALAHLLQWTYQFSATLDPRKQLEMRLCVLMFVARAFAPREPAFELQAFIGARKTNLLTDLSCSRLIQAFRFYQQRGDQQRATAAALLVWKVVGGEREDAIMN
jgi:hypothetical protein